MGPAAAFGKHGSCEPNVAEHLQADDEVARCLVQNHVVNPCPHLLRAAYPPKHSARVLEGAQLQILRIDREEVGFPSAEVYPQRLREAHVEPGVLHQ